MPYQDHHCYRVYGLKLCSNIPIPGLDAETIDCDTVDIAINLGFFPDDIRHAVSRASKTYYVDTEHDEDGTPHLIVNSLENEDYFHFIYEYGVEFVLDRDGTVVWGVWKTPLVLEDAALYLLGPIIGFMLRIRGITCLHASGIVIDGKALALTGPSGVGKSTLAASFAAAGYPVLTDDILPFAHNNGVITAKPGYSRLRLLPNSFKKLPGIPNNLPSLAPSWDKCYLDLTLEPYERYAKCTELQAIYVIDWSSERTDTPTISPLRGATAFSLLAANTYRNELLSPRMRSEEFFFLGQLISKTEIRKLRPIDDIFSVSRIRDLLVEDFRKGSSAENVPAERIHS